MKKDFFSIIRRSLSARLSLWIVLFAATLFMGALGYLFYLAQQAVRREAIRGATSELDNTILRVNGILEDIELVANNMDWLIYQNMDHPDVMMELSHQVVANNSFLNGCSISFEPYYYPEKGKYYSAYSNFNGHTIYTQQEGNDQYQYFYRDWYLLPKLLNQPCWTEPYTDQEEADDSVMDSKMSVSYCRPIIGNDGSFAGVFSLDISLEWLSETISKVKPYPHSYAIMLGRGGTFLVHPNEEKLFYQTIFTEGMLHPNPEVQKLGTDMLDWKEGMQVLNLEGEDSYIFYKPMMATGWSVAIVCPEKDIFGSFRRLQQVVILLVFLGLMLMFFIVSRIIRGELSPLSTLAGQAETIASGHFEKELPHMARVDEIGVLNRSFRYMQTSLVNYIDELTQATAKKERIEGELQIARDIQMGMVPRTFPPFPNRRDVDVYASITPAKEVGGDLYDYFIQHEKLYFCIGDVSGKGVPASLFMAVARNLFRLVAQQELPPAEVARQINDTLSENNDQLMFITMFFGALDLHSGILEYCNCGHNPPVLLSSEPRFLDCLPNTPIGVCPGWQFEGQSIQCIKNMPIFLYTDGLNEAENLAHEEFGNDRMMKALSNKHFTSAQDLIDSMKATVATHVGEAEASDDMTMLCINLC